jgi:hypothetical protein
VKRLSTISKHPPSLRRPEQDSLNSVAFVQSNPPNRLARTFAALQHRNYRLFMFGQVANLTGNWMQTVGQGWLIYRLTGSPVALGAFIPIRPDGAVK